MSWREIIAGKSKYSIGIVAGAMLVIIMLVIAAKLATPGGSLSSVLTTAKRRNFETNDIGLQQATNIFQQLETYTNKDGYYGNVQTCRQVAGDELSCDTWQSQTTSGDSALAVIWARYQYYKKTGDKDQLAQLERDVATMAKNVQPDNLRLASSRFNCLYLADIVNAPEVSANTRALARQICDQAPFMYAPQSVMAGDQHDHPQVVDSAAGSDVGPYTITSNYLPPDQRRTYTKEEILEEITNELDQFLLTGRIDVNFDNFSGAKINGYLGMEAAAPIDQIAGMRVDEANLSAFAQREIDYLLLTKETLEWYSYLTQDLGWNPRPEASSLLDLNLRYLFSKYLPDYSETNREYILELLNYDQVTNKQARDETAILADWYLNDWHPDKFYIIDRFAEINELNNLPDWESGLILEGDASTWYWQVTMNAIYAGLLSQ